MEPCSQERTKRVMRVAFRHARSGPPKPTCLDSAVNLKEPVTVAHDEDRRNKTAFFEEFASYEIWYESFL